MAADWWNADGPMRPLHLLNPARLGYIRDAAAQHFGVDRGKRQPLAGLRLLDLGCGAGLVSEPLARLGAEVVGVDAAAENIAAARAHAAQSGLSIDYRCTSAEDLAAAGEQFDLVIFLEVVEHVADVALFIQTIAKLLKPSGAAIFSTPNRTSASFALVIVGAEYVLRWLPRGTHDWRKFLTPPEFKAQLRSAGLAVQDISGLSFEPLAERFAVTQDLSVNYIGWATLR
jgi:2-polyprenyl-6-hydroxyphenyl methylase / 3-demethylubiquinone-9 3-methyltransferase